MTHNTTSWSMYKQITTRIVSHIPGHSVLRSWYYQCVHQGYIHTISRIIRSRFERQILKEAILCDLGMNIKHVKIFGRKIKVDLLDHYIGKQIYRQRIYEPHLTKLITKLLKPGMYFVDIGANIGYFTILASTRIGENGYIVACEPEPSAFAFLQHNCKINKLQNVYIENCALGDDNKTGYLHKNSRNYGDHRMCDTQLGSGDIEPVKIVTGDELLADLKIQRVDVIKIDVQGYEPKVLAGLQKTLSRNPHCIIISEFWPWGIAQYNEDPYEYFVKALGESRRAFAITNNGVHNVVDYQSLEKYIPKLDINHPDSSYVDVVFCPPDLIS